LTVTLLFTCAGCAEWVLLHPTIHPISTSARRQWVPLDGERRLELWVERRHCQATDRAPDPRPLFLLEFTGNAARAEAASQHQPGWWGCRTLVIHRANYPGYGGSSGPARLIEIPAATLAAYDVVAKRAREQGAPLIVYGNSLGTTAALYLASRRELDGVVLKNPVPLQDLVLRRFGWWNLWLGALPIALQIPHALNAMQTAARAKAPLVLVTSAGDTLVPPRFQHEIFARYAGPKRRVIMPHAHHNSSLSGSRELVSALRWILRTIDAQQRPPDLPPPPFVPL
jgi:pimeloyl-ACP methyl ester carboxylesterase